MKRSSNPNPVPINPFAVTTVSPIFRKLPSAEVNVDLQPNQIRAGADGGPKYSITRKFLTEALNDQLATTQDNRNRASEIAAIVITRCLDGDLDFIKFLAERTEGKAVGRSEAGKPGAFSDLEELIGNVDEDDARSIVDAADRFRGIGS